DDAYVSRAHKHHSYLARGDYARQLDGWFARFPREQLLILRSEDFFARPAETFSSIAAFLGIDDDVSVPVTAQNRSQGPPLDPALQQRLAEHFAPYNARLHNLLGWDPGWK